MRRFQGRPAEAYAAFRSAQQYLASCKQGSAPSKDLLPRCLAGHGRPLP